MYKWAIPLRLQKVVLNTVEIFRRAAVVNLSKQPVLVSTENDRGSSQCFLYRQRNSEATEAVAQATSGIERSLRRTSISLRQSHLGMVSCRAGPQASLSVQLLRGQENMILQVQI